MFWWKKQSPQVGLAALAPPFGMARTKAGPDSYRNDDFRKTQHFRPPRIYLLRAGFFACSPEPGRNFRSFGSGMQIVILGISGAVGSTLAPQLLAAGHEVRGFSRRAPDLSANPALAGVEFRIGDAVSGAGLDRALRGADVAYYLIHSMESQAGNAFPQYEARAAEHFAFAAKLAGVRRTLYLGGPVPPVAVPSPHLASRLAVERLLLAATPEALAFRASIVIGAHSRSFRFLVRLIERMPVLALPAWRDHRTAPIDERDVSEFLLRAATVELSGRRALDIAGPETLSYRQLIERIRDLMLLSRPTLGLPSSLTLTPIAARIAALIASEDPAFIEPLMESLDSDLLPDGTAAAELLGVRRHGLDAAINHALAQWERREPLRAR